MGATVAARGLVYSVGGRQVLQGVDLTVGPGELVSVIGISGGGKTSLLKCLAGLLRPMSGQVLLDGVNLAALSESALNEQRRRIGMVFQYAALFDSLTVFDNVAFGLRYHRMGTPAEIRRVVAEQLAAVGMAGTEDLFPEQLSGGMRKRVGLARALAMGPQVLFYDEPTSGLDPVLAGVIDDLITDVRRRLGVSSVVVSHDVESVLRISDRVAMLHEGRIVFQGTPEEARRSEEPAVRQFLTGSPEGPIQVLR
ncbi:MAG: ATP-binding cassette domain-containing protein [Armatimonadetes bacterium]|nr:ATP-binding cassette domain-containing protein [Armatimonadota bacterium]